MSNVNLMKSNSSNADTMEDIANENELQKRMVSGAPQSTPQKSLQASALSPSTKVQLSLEERYIHDSIAQIFKVSLLSRGITSTFLERMAGQGKIYFRLDDVDQIIWEKGLYIEGGFLDWLMEVYNKIHHEISEVADKKNKLPIDFRKAFLHKLEVIVVRYAHLYLMHPESFPENFTTELVGVDRGAAALLQQLLVPVDHPGFVPKSFFTSLAEVARSDLKAIISSLLTQIIFKIRQMNINSSEWYPLLKTIEIFSAISDYAAILVTHPYWIPQPPSSRERDGKLMEERSLIGVFFALHGADTHVAEHFFGGGKTLTMTRNDVIEAKTIIVQRHKNLQATLKNVLLNLLRNAEYREHVLKWFAVVLEANETRNRLRDDMLHSSSDGFMLNLTNVLLRLSDPFLDKMNLNIDPDFPMTNELISVFKEDTKVHLGTKEAALHYSNVQKKDFNFITSCYYLTLRCIHIGFVRSSTRFTELIKSQSHVQRMYESFKEAEHLHQAEIAQIEPQLIQMWIRRWAIETLLLETDLHQELLKFFRFSIALLMKFGNLSDKLESIPPTIEEIPMSYRAQPEHMVENILDSLIFLGRTHPSSLQWGQYDEMFTYFLGLLNFGYLVKNPYIRAKIPETLVFFVPSNEAPHEVKRLVMAHPLTKDYLMRGFMKLYVEIEQTGATSQFYDKFTPRFWISIVMKSLWHNTVFQNAFKKEADLSDPHAFLKFFNMLLNDSIFLLDESLKMLKEIHVYEDEMKRGVIPPNEVAQRQRQVQQNTPALQSYMMLARETVNMMHYLSRDFPLPFLRPEMAPRVASMLNYFIMHLAGEECQSLKVQNAEKYHFNPKELITLLSETYVHFSPYDEFVNAVARDERSYNAEILGVKVPSILNRIGIPKKFIDQFVKFAQVVEARVNELNRENEDFGDAPDEFLDAITYDIMEDPVKLPSSGVVLDRATIERHLLNDNTDPFNRAPLTIKDLIPQPELKAEIEKWKASRRK